MCIYWDFLIKIPKADSALGRRSRAACDSQMLKSCSRNVISSINLFPMLMAVLKHEAKIMTVPLSLSLSISENEPHALTRSQTHVNTTRKFHFGLMPPSR
jgi:hypothetical protein